MSEAEGRSVNAEQQGGGGDGLDAEDARPTTSQIVRTLDFNTSRQVRRSRVLFGILTLTAMFAMGAVVWPLFTESLPGMLLDQLSDDEARSKTRNDPALARREMRFAQLIESWPDPVSRSRILLILTTDRELTISVVRQAYGKAQSLDRKRQLLNLVGHLRGNVSARFLASQLDSEGFESQLTSNVLKALCITGAPQASEALLARLDNTFIKAHRSQTVSSLVLLLPETAVKGLKARISAENSPVIRGLLTEVISGILIKAKRSQAALVIARTVNKKTLARVARSAKSTTGARLQAISRLEQLTALEELLQLAADGDENGEPSTVELNILRALIRMSETSEAAQVWMGSRLEALSKGSQKKRKQLFVLLLGRYGGAKALAMVEKVGTRDDADLKQAAERIRTRLRKQ